MEEEKPEIDNHQKKRLHSNVNAQARTNEYPDDFQVLNDQLFCRYCNKTIDHSKESTVTNHLASKMHIKNKFGAQKHGEIGRAHV